MSQDIERLPPHSQEAEEAVLGSLLIDPQAVNQVATFLEAAHFYVVKNRWIYAAMLALSSHHQPIDFLTVTEALQKKGELEDAGGAAYLIGLMNTVPTSINAEHYAKIVQDAAMRRQMIASGSVIANLGYDQSQPIEVAIESAERSVFSISAGRADASIRTAREVTRSYLEMIEDAAAGGQAGIPTGFGVLDNMTNGLNRSDLIIIAARPGMGKTSLQNGIALNAALRSKKNVAMFNLEMSGEQLVQRMASSLTNIEIPRLRKGELTEAEWLLFMETCGRLSETNIFIDDTPSLSPTQLRAKCRRLHAEHGLDLIMVDYLQLMTGDSNGGGFGNRVQEMGEISRGLKVLAREINVPVVAAAQLSRAVESRVDKRPQLSDLRDSGTIEQDADIVMFIYRDDYYNPETTERPNIAELSIAKQRNGPTGVVDLYWQATSATFRNLVRSEIQL